MDLFLYSYIKAFLLFYWGCNIDIAFFSTGTWNPKKEKYINVEEMEKVFKVNFFGTVNCIKAVEEYFIEKQNGTITLVSSIAGYRGLPNSTAYGPSKSALNTLAETLYFYFKKSNVRICLMFPAFFRNLSKKSWKTLSKSEHVLRKTQFHLMFSKVFI